MADDEIAALEARLAELKQRAAEEDAAETAAAQAVVASNQVLEEIDDFDATTLSYRKRVANVKAVPSEFLSEAWKQEEATSAGTTGAALPALALLLVIIALSQVPTSLDIDSIGSQAVRLETPAEIRARYSEVGIE